MARLEKSSSSSLKASLWPENTPDRLEDLCLQLMAKDLSIIAHAKRLGRNPVMENVSTSVDSGQKEGEISGDPVDFDFSGVDPRSECYSLRPGIYFSSHICDILFALIAEGPNEMKEQQKFQKLSIFSDRQTAILNRANLCGVSGQSLVNVLTMLASQPLMELTMPMVWRCLPVIKKMHTLRSLRLEKEPETSQTDAFIQTMGSSVDSIPVFSEDQPYFQLTCPNLRRLILSNLVFQLTRNTQSDQHNLRFNTRVVQTLVSPLNKLTHLSLNNCQIILEDLDFLSRMTSLVWLNLSNIKVIDFDVLIALLTPLQNLQHLDLSQGNEDGNPVIYRNADNVLKRLMDTFPQLISLDVSGTNLAGFERPETISHRLGPGRKGEMEVEDPYCPIPGLEGRQLEFLGLYNCAYNPCLRKDLPAKRVTGDADSNQVVLAVQVYVDNQSLLIKALNDLFNLFRFSTVANHRQALEGVLAAMKAYPNDSSIQIAGSASLFYIVKGDCKEFITYQHKKELVHLLLTAMHKHSGDQTMMRNACLTLCHLNLPADAMSNYKRLVKQLLEMLEYDYSDVFIHRLGIFLVNCLACQVDGREKELVGRLGGVEIMLTIITRKMRQSECDDVLEVAWSTLWNVTDETPINCEKFLNKGGLQLFVGCLKKFVNKAELLRNMMGLMGNIAEVDALRSHLMTEEYVTIFSDLLGSTSDGIEVSYNACGVLSHLCFDGEDAWSIPAPSRQSVMERMKKAIKRWPIQSKRNINYRSFLPILRLVEKEDTSVVQLWACWALCNLTTVSPEKYCRLLEREGGRPVLEKVVADPQVDADIRDLAKRTLNRLDMPCGEDEQNAECDIIDGNDEDSNDDDDDDEIILEAEDERDGGVDQEEEEEFVEMENGDVDGLMFDDVEDAV